MDCHDYEDEMLYMLLYNVLNSMLWDEMNYGMINYLTHVSLTCLEEYCIWSIMPVLWATMEVVHIKSL